MGSPYRNWSSSPQESPLIPRSSPTRLTTVLSARNNGNPFKTNRINLLTSRIRRGTPTSVRMARENERTLSTLGNTARIFDAPASDKRAVRLQELETAALEWDIERAQLQQQLNDLKLKDDEACSMLRENELLEELSDREARISAMSLDLEDLMNDLASSKASMQNAEEELQEKSQNLAQLEAEKNALRAEMISMSEELEQTKWERHEALNQVLEANDLASFSRKDLENTRVSMEELESRERISERQISSLKQALELAEARASKAEQATFHAESQAKNLADQRNVAQKALAEVSLLQDRLTQAQSAQDDMIAKLHDIQQDLNRTTLAASSSAQHAAIAEEQLLQTRTKLSIEQARVQSLTSAAAARDGEEEEEKAIAAKNMAAAESELNLARSQAKSLRLRLDQIESMQNQSAQQALKRAEEAEKNAECLRELHQLERCNAQRLLVQLQELKGNIRVVARVRPGALSSRLQLAYSSIILREVISSYSGATEREHVFDFDRVFGPQDANLDVFEEIEYLVRGVVEGARGCVFAYGQTGSGKTWTMSSADGLVRRALSLLLQSKPERVELECVEIYNESIVDLIPRRCDQKPSAPKLSIQTSPVTNKVGLVGANRSVVSSLDDAERLLTEASRQRSVAATASNERSSRSHCVLIVHVTRGVSTGVLNLVDLAGSERLAQSQTTGDRLRETQAINKSLSCLGDVINALISRHSTHIPFRNSKLTHLLQDSLSGTSKAIMVVSLAPEDRHLAETLSSLRFAAKVEKARIRR